MEKNHLSLMIYITNEVNKIANKKMKEIGMVGFSITHGTILERLFENDGKMTMKDLAIALSRTKSTVTQLVDKLIAFGFVTKVQSQTDKRYYYVCLTKKAYTYREDLGRVSLGLYHMLYDESSEKDLQVSVQVLKKMAQAIENHK